MVEYLLVKSHDAVIGLVGGAADRILGQHRPKAEIDGSKQGLQNARVGLASTDDNGVDIPRGERAF
nr:hypothetical protein [Mesorhizobium sp. SARCC-RB16n]